VEEEAEEVAVTPSRAVGVVEELESEDLCFTPWR
jgi:hypothetical protein